MVCGIISSFSGIFHAVSSEKCCSTSMSFLLTYTDVRTVQFSSLLDLDYSIHISGAPAVCKDEKSYKSILIRKNYFLVSKIPSVKPEWRAHPISDQNWQNLSRFSDQTAHTYLAHIKEYAPHPPPPYPPPPRGFDKVFICRVIIIIILGLWQVPRSQSPVEFPVISQLPAHFSAMSKFCKSQVSTISFISRLKIRI